MPPPSPAPGWASGDVCNERTASLRTTGGTLPGWALFPACRGWVDARHEHALVLVPERGVDLDERLLLRLGQRRIAEDVADEVLLAGALFQDAGAHVEGLGGDSQRLGD